MLRRRQGSMTQAQPQQQQHIQRVAAHFSANRSRPLAVLFSGFDHGFRLAATPPDRRALYRLGHRFVVAIGGQRILNQIVRADGEEIDLAGQLLRL